MTRINCVPVQELCNQHLFAEWREMPRINKYMQKSFNAGFNIDNIPPEYLLGSGHVKFFYNKLEYINNRYNELTTELLERGYNIEVRPLELHYYDQPYNNDWQPSEADMELNRARIQERMPKDARWSNVVSKS
jgi:deoxyribonuclease (pyrimidine dimer)